MKVRKNIKSTIYHIYYHYHIQIYIQKVLGEWMIIVKLREREGHRVD